MMALENYLDDDELEKTLPILKKAVEKRPRSYAANLVKTLVECQLMMADIDGWGEVWEHYRKFQTNDQLTRKLKPEARDLVTEYLKLYEEYADQPE